MARDKLLLDPFGRRMANIFTAADLARVHKVADVYWGLDAQMPPAEVDRFREQMDFVVTDPARDVDEGSTVTIVVGRYVEPTPPPTTPTTPEGEAGP